MQNRKRCSGSLQVRACILTKQGLFLLPLKAARDLPMSAKLSQHQQGGKRPEVIGFSLRDICTQHMRQMSDDDPHERAFTHELNSACLPRNVRTITHYPFAWRRYLLRVPITGTALFQDPLPRSSTSVKRSCWVKWADHALGRDAQMP